MSQSYITEYYRQNDRPVALLMTPERIALQAWFANPETHRFERGSNALLFDITEGGNHQGRMDDIECAAFCRNHKIDPVIIPKNLSLSWKLAEQNKRRIQVPSFAASAPSHPLFLVPCGG